ncbi:MAG: hypothetical protein J3K34DRAFT_466038 [Monoraphidium minutum]|nr:MAG: hypothetical protein J3K34DRAFT_466038 [Monoraphidium minutum]
MDPRSSLEILQGCKLPGAAWCGSACSSDSDRGSPSHAAAPSHPPPAAAGGARSGCGGPPSSGRASPASPSPGPGTGRRVSADDITPHLLCGICREPAAGALVLGCGHLFCSGCLAGHVLRAPACPACGMALRAIPPRCPPIDAIVAALLPALPAPRRAAFERRRQAGEGAPSLVAKCLWHLEAGAPGEGAAAGGGAPAPAPPGGCGAPASAAARIGAVQAAAMAAAAAASAAAEPPYGLGYGAAFDGGHGAYGYGGGCGATGGLQRFGAPGCAGGYGGGGGCATTDPIVGPPCLPGPARGGAYGGSLLSSLHGLQAAGAQGGGAAHAGLWGPGLYSQFGGLLAP